MNTDSNGCLPEHTDEEVVDLLGNLEKIDAFPQATLKRAIFHLDSRNKQCIDNFNAILPELQAFKLTVTQLKAENVLIQSALKTKDVQITELSKQVSALSTRNEELNRCLEIVTTNNPSAPKSPTRKRQKNTCETTHEEHSKSQYQHEMQTTQHSKTKTQHENTSPLNNNGTPTKSVMKNTTDFTISTLNRFAVLEDMEINNSDSVNDVPNDVPNNFPFSQSPMFQISPAHQLSQASEQIAPQAPSCIPATQSQQQQSPDLVENTGFIRETRPFNRIPPITIRNFGSWSTLREELLKLTTEKFTSKNFGQEMKILFKSADDYRAAAHLFKLRKIEHVVFHLPTEPTLRVVLKRVHESIDVEDIKSELEAQNIDPIKITRLRKSENSPASPLILVQLINNSQNKKIFHLTEVLGTAIMVESFKKRNEAIQCYNCQGFGHGASSCHLVTKCVKCSQNHNSRDCPFPKNSIPKCTNCLGSHVASFRGCPKFPQPNTTPIINKDPIPAPIYSDTTFPQLGPQKRPFHILPPLHSNPGPQKSYAQAAASTQLKKPNFQALISSMLQHQAAFMAQLQSIMSQYHE